MANSLIGERFDRYVVLEKVGSSCTSFCDYYRARDDALERDVILVVCPSRNRADEAERHRDEAAALSRLDHPNVASLLAFGNSSDMDYLVFDYLTLSLSRKLLDGPLIEAEVSRLGVQLAEGLAYLHAAGVLLHDLTPSMVWLLPDGGLKISCWHSRQFLLATPAERAASGAPMGWPPYTAPEVLLHEKIDARSDLYSAGAVLYEMATGRTPFPWTSPRVMIEQVLNGSPVPPRTVRKELSRALESILIKALEKGVALRYQSAYELKADLERLCRRSKDGLPRWRLKWW